MLVTPQGKVMARVAGMVTNLPVTGDNTFRGVSSEYRLDCDEVLLRAEQGGPGYASPACRLQL